MQIDQLVEDTFYTLYHDYGTVVTVSSLVKRDVDPSTGEREANPVYTLDAVFTPVGINSSFFAKALGRDDAYSTVFMIQTIGDVQIMPSDSIRHGNIVYRNLTVARYGTISLVTGEGDK